MAQQTASPRPVETGPRRLWRHMKALWPRYTLLPGAPFVLWSLYCLARGEKRWELVVICLAVPPLVYWNEWSKRLFLGVLPFGLVGILYDFMRFVKNVGLSETSVHVCDLRDVEVRWFGVTSGGVRMTVHDWFQRHWWTPVDLFCAIPYGVFLFVPFGYMVYLYFRDRTALARFGWTFFFLNVAGFITYHLYPAAPPWYFHAKGCVVDLASHASEGAPLSRVDAILGFQYFGGLYGRSNDVFGAVPSLHVSYPLLMVLEGWRLHRWPARVVLVVYMLSTCFAAAYLDHHWIVDIVLGLAYTIAIWPAVRWWVARAGRRAVAAVEEGVAAAPILEGEGEIQGL